MSLIGNFTANNDRTQMMSGIGQGHGTNYQQDRFDQSGAEAYPLQDRPLGRALSRGYTREDPTGVSSSTDTSLDQDGMARERVQELARQLTRQSSRHHESASVHGGAAAGSESGDFLIEKGSELDPFSDNFNAKAWTRKIVGVTSRDPVNHPKRTAGVAFKNLKVHGFGSDSGYQPTIGNAVLAGLGSIKETLGGKKQKIDILKGFDGLLDAGDMLVVLGPPGRCVEACQSFSDSARLLRPL
jgi:ATP-binding cassette subfamily G (WHITE) protein 2 (PDR)